MPFTETQKKRFIELLEAKGWEMREGTIRSASRGLWFNDSHFAYWSPSQIHEILSQRAERIIKTKIGNWEILSREHQEVIIAAQQVKDL